MARSLQEIALEDIDVREVHGKWCVTLATSSGVMLLPSDSESLALDLGLVLRRFMLDSFAEGMHTLTEDLRGERKPEGVVE